jgi:CheY-like chemotaxis protein
MKPYCVLIDNDEDDREVFELALREAEPNLAFRGFENGPAAIAWLDTCPPSWPKYIFIDMNMPMMTGPECFAVLRTRPALEGIPTYIYSTAVDPRTSEELHRNGITAFLEKPSSYGALTRLLASIIHTQKAEK